MPDNESRLIQYGVSQILALKAAHAGLTVSKIRSLSLHDMTGRFELSLEESRYLKKCVLRAPIDADVAELLLE